MKRSVMLRTIGGILITIGILIIIWFGIFGDQTERFEIPAGDEYYYYFETPSSAIGQIKGDFSAQVGTVDMYILTQSQYTTYSYWGEPRAGSLYATSGSSGTFSCNLSGSGKTYIVFDHGAGYASVAQSVTVRLDTTAIDVMTIVVGLALIILGAIFVFYSNKMKKKEMSAEPQQQPSSVILFEEKKQ
ncbi:MAG: hypothetical protein QXE18_00450 [Thermoplasmata archaeon]